MVECTIQTVPEVAKPGLRRMLNQIKADQKRPGVTDTDCRRAIHRAGLNLAKLAPQCVPKQFRAASSGIVAAAKGFFASGATFGNPECDGVLKIARCMVRTLDPKMR